MDATQASVNQRALARALHPFLTILTLEQCQKFVDFRSDGTLQSRIEVLAGKRNEGELTSDERSEYEGYAAANRILAVLQEHIRAYAERQKPESE